MTSSRIPRRSLLAVSTAITATALAGCGLTAPGGGGDTSGGSDDGSAEGGDHPALVVAGTEELGAFNPVSGYGEQGGTPLYEGLLRLKSTDPEQLPELEPALATEAPTASDDLTTWRVPVREDVTFHDGSELGPEDVVATYEAVLDPASASEVAWAYDMLESVEADGNEVVFHLKDAYADFPSRLLLGIAPSEKLDGGPATESSLNREPVGTGPMRLTSLEPTEATLERFDDYWGESGAVPKLTITRVPDEGTRAQQARTGEIDGTILPPKLAESTAQASEDLELVTASTADWRGVSFPAKAAIAQDPATRIAMNHAVDRQAMIDTVLGGHGTPAATPVSSIYGDAYEDVQFEHDPQKAEQMLDEAGWKPGKDGIRTKDGERAEFTVAYDPKDSVRRDLATAFAEDLKKVGIDVSTKAMTWDEIEPQYEDLAILLGGGDKPYSIDSQVFSAVHTPLEGAAFYYNPGGQGSDQLDELLEQARTETDAEARDELYRQVQQEVAKDPNGVYLTFLEHTYVHDAHGYSTGDLVVEPHAHSVAWGPWWNVGAWK
ncbi:ABC transporter substrate-binding protein [Kytococcus sedentarius]|uniref:ABC transporter substrate-binding protein n=1 Tax=Kytococcus sedentarius TaxID=1276 RepID=UPI0035BBB10F